MSIRLAFALALLATGARAQGFTPPASPSPGMPAAPAFQEAPPAATFQGAPPAMPGAPRARPGFGAPPAQEQVQAPARQNYADERTDFGVQPQAQLQENVGSPTPTTIPGAHVITTAEMRQAVDSNIVFIDVLAGPPHPSLPGALMMPGAGAGGSFDDALQEQLWNALAQATQRQADRPIVFFCAGSRCWESYNAALRAVQMGFKTVLWYRGGLAAWQAAGLPFGGGGAEGHGAPGPARPRPGFGTNPG